MALRTGTLTLDDLLVETEIIGLQDKEEAITAAIERELEIHSRALAEEMSEFVEITTDRQRVDPATHEIGEGSPLTETGRAPTQIAEATTVTLGFWLFGWQYSIGWTQRALDQSTAADLAKTVLAAQEWHVRKMSADLKRAFYGSSNFTKRDFLMKDKININVKRFYNADSWPIPMGPNGESFDGSSHTHYTGKSSLTASDLKALIGNVREHDYNADVRVIINLADEETVSGLTGFKAYTPTTLVHGNTDGTAVKRLTGQNPANRAIGLFNGAEVWTKPWAIENYAVAYTISGAKPLVLRVPPNRGGLPSLRLAATNRAYPLLTQFMETEYGFSTSNRAAAAILDFDSSGGTYRVPTING